MQIFTIFLTVMLCCIRVANAEITFDSFLERGGAIEHFQSSTFDDENSGVYFEFISDEKTQVTVAYHLNGNRSEISTQSIEANKLYKFPEEGKKIYLDKDGLNKFEFLFATGDKIERSIFSENKKRSLKPAIKLLKGLEKSALTANAPKTYSKFDEVVFKGSANKYALNQTRSSGTEIYRKLSSSVVLIDSGDSMGTGSILAADGTILTNWHVIGAKPTVNVVFKPQGFKSVNLNESFLADVIKIDEEKDLALLMLRNPPSNLKPIKLAKISQLEVAMDVHAIGHPKGNFWTYTKGVVSQLRPKFNWEGDGDLIHAADVIQTQTPINPGNSGGPLLLDSGLMIGVNSFIDPGADGLNYAVAVSSVEEFLGQIQSYKNAPKKQQPLTKQDAPIPTFDLDQNGVNESVQIDQNNNGIVDLIKSDFNGDGEFETLFYDENENGIIELEIRIIDENGEKQAVWFIDEDENEVVEKRGWDFDFDGKLDKVDNI